MRFKFLFFAFVLFFSILLFSRCSNSNNGDELPNKSLESIVGTEWKIQSMSFVDAGSIVDDPSSNAVAEISILSEDIGSALARNAYVYQFTNENVSNDANKYILEYYSVTDPTTPLFSTVGEYTYAPPSPDVNIFLKEHSSLWSYTTQITESIQWKLELEQVFTKQDLENFVLIYFGKRREYNDGIQLKLTTVLYPYQR